MNILWITNMPIGRLRELAGLSGENTSGSWLTAALPAFAGANGLNLTVVTVGRVSSPQQIVEGNITYCLLPGGFPGEYVHTSPSNAKDWAYVKAQYRPDIIHVWGTEFTHGFLALKVMSDIPAIIYMQGLLKAISRYYLAGMSRWELLRSISLRDVLKGDWITRTQKNYASRALVEAEMIQLAQHVIIENRWCATHCSHLGQDIVPHHCDLNIGEAFLATNWRSDSVRPHTVMSNAGGYPIKGLHMLIKAMKLVTRRFPEAKLFIPGDTSPFNLGSINWLRENGYTRFIRTLITDSELEKSIVFLGPLSPEQIAQHMATINAFVMPSSIENHSSTLIEAMTVGAPCLSAYVRGIPEEVSHQQNGLLYRVEEYEMLAEHICDLFSDPVYAARLGAAASHSMRTSRSHGNVKERLVEIYEKVLQGPGPNQIRTLPEVPGC